MAGDGAVLSGLDCEPGLPPSLGRSAWPWGRGRPTPGPTGAASTPLGQGGDYCVVNNFVVFFSSYSTST